MSIGAMFVCSKSSNRGERVFLPMKAASFEEFDDEQ